MHTHTRTPTYIFVVHDGDGHAAALQQVNVSVLQFQVLVHIVKVTKFVHHRTNFPSIVPLPVNGAGAPDTFIWQPLQ